MIELDALKADVSVRDNLVSARARLCVSSQDRHLPPATQPSCYPPKPHPPCMLEGSFSTSPI